MAISYGHDRQLLAANSPEANEVRLELQDYLARTGMALPDFAHRINYSRETVYHFLSGHYSRISSNDRPIRAAIRDFIAAHPDCHSRRHDRQALRNPECPFAAKILLRGTGSSSGVLRLRRSRNSEDLRPAAPDRGVELLGDCQEWRGSEGLLRLRSARHPVAGPDEAGGGELRRTGHGTVDRILRNLRFDLSQRKVLLVFDEAQHLSIECLETMRELLDQPPHCGLLFAGTHELEEIFTRQALELEQWRSRFHAGQALPGISEEEAAEIVHSELGLELSQRKIQKLIAKSRITDLAQRWQAQTMFRPGGCSG